MKKQKIFGSIILLLSVSILVACNTSNPNTLIKETTNQEVQVETNGRKEEIKEEVLPVSYSKISQEEAKKRIDTEQNTIILDVRTKEEYLEKHIPGALLIPNESIGDDELKELPDKDAEILIYCRSGNRSKDAAEKLIQKGYTNVHDFGGINTWEYEMVSGEDMIEKDESGFSDFLTIDIYQNQVDETIFADYDLTMINIWGTFCGPCLVEMPSLGKLNKEYKEKGFQVIGIVIDVFNQDGTLSSSQVDLAKEAVTKTGADYIHLLPSNDLIQAKIKDVSAVPETIFVDQLGNIVGKSYLGAKSESEWKKIIDSMLEEVK